MCFFFFKQKTAYDMRISDWSSDVCSSDLYPENLSSDIVASGIPEHFQHDVNHDNHGRHLQRAQQEGLELERALFQMQPNAGDHVHHQGNAHERAELLIIGQPKIDQIQHKRQIERANV